VEGYSYEGSGLLLLGYGLGVMERRNGEMEVAI
jgi:hypothetical protein